MDTDNLQQQNPDVQVEDTTIGDSLRRILADDGDLEPDNGIINERAGEEGDAPGDQAQGEQEPEPQGQPADAFEVVGEDGQTYKIPKALEGYLLRQADYSRKTADLAREREMVNEARVVNEQAYTIVQQLGPVLAEFHSARAKMEQFNQVDWDALYDSDPLLHNKLKLEARDNLDKLQNLGTALQKAPQVLEAVQTRALAAETARNYPIAKQLVPDFESRKDELAAVARHYGFSEAEIRNTPDARVVYALAHLAEYQRMLAGRGQVQQRIASAPPVVKPGNKNAPAGATQKTVRDAMRTLRDDSSDDAFVAAMRASRKQKGG